MDIESALADGKLPITCLHSSLLGSFSAPLNSREIQDAGLDFPPCASSRIVNTICVRMLEEGKADRRYQRRVRPRIRPWSQGGLNMVSKWSQSKIEQKTTNLAQSKICAKLLNSKGKVVL